MEEKNNPTDQHEQFNIDEKNNTTHKDTLINEQTNTLENEEDFKNKYLRLYAEFDNYKKRTAKEKIEWIQTAGKDIICSLLEILDDCERAEKEFAKNKNEHTEKLQEGLLLIFNKLKKNLEQKGLQPVESINKPFDTEFHEAITQLPVEKEEQKGIVIDEVEKGYILNGKIIRYAKVVVGQ